MQIANFQNELFFVGDIAAYNLNNDLPASAVVSYKTVHHFMCNPWPIKQTATVYRSAGILIRKWHRMVFQFHIKWTSSYPLLVVNILFRFTFCLSTRLDLRIINMYTCRLLAISDPLFWECLRTNCFDPGCGSIRELVQKSATVLIKIKLVFELTSQTMTPAPTQIGYWMSVKQLDP